MRPRAATRKWLRRRRIIQRFGAVHSYARTIRKPQKLGPIPEGRQVRAA